MKVLERGVKPGDRVHQARCLHCKTLIEFARSEAKYVPDQRDGDALVVMCPTCDEPIWVAA